MTGPEFEIRSSQESYQMVGIKFGSVWGAKRVVRDDVKITTRAKRIFRSQKA